MLDFSECVIVIVIVIDVHTPQPLSCRCVANATVCLLCGDRTRVRNVTWCVACCSVTSCHVVVNGQRERTTCELCETNRIFWTHLAQHCLTLMCLVCCMLCTSWFALRLCVALLWSVCRLPTISVWRSSSLFSSMSKDLHCEALCHVPH